MGSKQSEAAARSATPKTYRALRVIVFSFPREKPKKDFQPFSLANCQGNFLGVGRSFIVISHAQRLFLFYIRAPCAKSFPIHCLAPPALTPINALGAQAVIQSVRNSPSHSRTPRSHRSVPTGWKRPHS